jgi:hypothetical protein
MAVFAVTYLVIAVAKILITEAVENEFCNKYSANGKLYFIASECDSHFLQPQIC